MTEQGPLRPGHFEVSETEGLLEAVRPRRQVETSVLDLFEPSACLKILLARPWPRTASVFDSPVEISTICFCLLRSRDFSGQQSRADLEHHAV